jgi:hypothetical protein
VHILTLLTMMISPRPSAAPPSAAQPPPDSQPIIVVMGQPGLDKKKLVDEAISLVGKQNRVRCASFHFQRLFFLFDESQNLESKAQTY